MAHGIWHMVRGVWRQNPSATCYVPRAHRAGFTLMEVLLVIFYTAIILLTVQSLILALALGTRQRHLEQASALADAELEILQAFPFASLSDRTNTRFRGILWNAGTWTVASDATAPSPSHAYTVAPSGTTGSTGIAQIPVGTVGDFTLTFHVLARASSPNGWRAGALFRTEDDANTYRVRFSATDIRLEKIVEGTVTNLVTTTQSFSLGSWHTIGITATGSSIELSLNGSVLATVTDTAFSKGVLALWGGSGAHASYDSVTVTTGLATDTWNFDTDAVGANPLVWKRFGVHDLPGGVDELTIAGYAGSTDIKQVTARIRWQERGARSVELTTLINKF